MGIADIVSTTGRSSAAAWIRPLVLSPSLLQNFDNLLRVDYHAFAVEEYPMLEHYLRTMYRDELEKLNLNATEIYDSYIAEARQISEPGVESEPHPLLKRLRRN